uniref:C-type lectin domain-containing protein n=1 Tax=Cyprinus carpio TaxID=7962 RepID=A0A8C1S287_CYPCA
QSGALIKVLQKRNAYFNAVLSTGLFSKTFCYFTLIQEPKTWTEAQSYCKKYNTDLATIQSDEDRYKIQEIYSQSEAWIGLSKNLWLWSDQSKVSWTSVKWAEGQPDNTNGNEKCGFVRETGLIGDEDCLHPLPFFCTDYKLKL